MFGEEIGIVRVGEEREIVPFGPPPFLKLTDRAEKSAVRLSLFAKEIVRAVTAGSKVLHVMKDEKVWLPLWLTFSEPKLTVVVDAQREGVIVKEIWLVYDCWARAKAKLPRRIRQDSAKVTFFMAP